MQVRTPSVTKDGGLTCLGDQLDARSHPIGLGLVVIEGGIRAIHMG